MSRWSFDAIAFRKALQLWTSLLAPIGVGVMLYCEIVFDHWTNMKFVGPLCVGLLAATKLTESRRLLVELQSSNPKIPTLRIVLGDSSDPDGLQSRSLEAPSPAIPSRRSNELNAPTSQP